MDVEEFVQWWKTIRRDIVNILQRYTRPIGHDIVKDLEQDVAYLAWKSRDRFADLDHFRGWTIQCAKWRAIDELRRNRRVAKALGEMENPENKEIDPGELAALREILEAVNQLPAQQRRVIRGIFEGKTEKNLAAELNVTESTIRSLRRFGRVKLHSILGGKHGNS